MGWCNKPTKLQFQYIFKPENFDALKRYESIEVDRRTVNSVRFQNSVSICMSQEVSFCISTTLGLLVEHLSPRVHLYGRV